MKRFKKMTELTAICLAVTMLAGCGQTTVTEPVVNVTEEENVSGGEEELISEGESTETSEAEEPFDGIIVKPDETVSMSNGDKIMVEGDEEFMMELTIISHYDGHGPYTAYFNVTNGDRLYEVLVEEQSEELIETYELTDKYFITGYIPHLMTVEDMTKEYITFSLSDIVVPKEAVMLSGNAEDVFEPEDYEYIETDMAFVYFDKEVKYPGNLAQVIDDTMYAVEEETGYKFYPEEEYNTCRCIRTAETYYGSNPWYGVNPYNDKINIFIVKDRGEGLRSCASSKEIVFSNENFLEKDGSIKSYNTIAHELIHVLFSNDTGECSSKIINEGLAMYYAIKVSKVLSTDYPVEKEGMIYEDDGAPYNLSEKNAEKLFLEDYIDSKTICEQEYAYGFFFITYLTETYGKDTVKEFFDVLNTKHGPRDCYYPDFICENLKEFYGEDLFTEFGKWFLQNKSKYCG